MRKIILSNFISLDGYFEGPNKELDWFRNDRGFDAEGRELLNSVDTILFGRTTYQLMAAFWPTELAAADDPVIRDKMNSLRKIVFSKTLDKLQWNNSSLLRKINATEIREMKQQPGKDMVIFGSGTIVTAFTQLRLIDEYRLIVAPVVLGSGNTLFKGVKDRLPLQLTQTKTLPSGSVLLYYR